MSAASAEHRQELSTGEPIVTSVITRVREDDTTDENRGVAWLADPFCRRSRAVVRVGNRVPRCEREIGADPAVPENSRHRYRENQVVAVAFWEALGSRREGSGNSRVMRRESGSKGAREWISVYGVVLRYSP